MIQNVMWRYSLDVLDVLPVCQVPLCGGRFTEGGCVREPEAGTYTEHSTFI